MKKLVFITLILLLSVDKSSFAQTTGWLNIAPANFQDYDIKGFYFGKTSSFQAYSTLCAYGINESDQTSKLAYSYNGGNNWTFYNKAISGLINNVSISYNGTYSDYSFVGTNGTVLTGSLGSWAQLSFDNAAEYANLDYVAGGFIPQSYGNPPKGALSDGTSLYYVYGQKQGSNTVQYIEAATVGTAIEGITDIIYGGGEILYAVGKEGQIFKSEDAGKNWELISSLAGVDFEDSMFVDNGFSSMLITATNTSSPTNTYLYTSTDGGVTVERVLTIESYGLLNDLIYVEKEDAYYTLCNDGTFLKIQGDYSAYEVVDMELPEGTTNLTGFTITNRMVKYFGGEDGLLHAYLPETKTIIEVTPSEEFEHVFSFRDLSEGYITSNKWDLEGVSIAASSNLTSLNNISFNSTGSFKVYLTSNLYTTAIGPGGNVVAHKDSIVVNPVTYFEWDLITNGTGSTISKIIFPEDQNMTGYYALDGGKYSGYVYKTTNGGDSWERILQTTSATETEPAKNVKGVTAMSFPTLEVGYAGTYCGSGWANGKQVYYAPELWKTENGGDNWTAIDLSAFNDIFSTKEHNFNGIHFFNENEGVVSMKDLTLYTTDGGETWTESERTLLEEGEALEITKMSFVNDALLYGIGTNQRVFKTEDKGKTWEKIATLTEETTAELNNISFYNSDFGIVISNTATDGILITEDGGGTWDVYNSGSESIMKTVHIANDSLVYIGGVSEAFMKSLDKGKTWTNINQPLIVMDYVDIATTSTGIGYASGTKSGLKRHIPDLTANFEMIIDADSTFVEFTEHSVGFIIGYKWEVNGEVVSEEIDMEGFALERPNLYNLYMITLTVEDRDGETSSMTKTIELTRNPIEPEKSTNPTPEDQAVLSNSQIDFAWSNNSTTEGGEIKYDIYLGTSATELEVIEENLSEKTYSYTVQKPENDTVYYWRIDTKNDETTAEGDVWSFTMKALGSPIAAFKSNLKDKELVFMIRLIADGSVSADFGGNIQSLQVDLEGSSFKNAYLQSVMGDSDEVKLYGEPGSIELLSFYGVSYSDSEITYADITQLSDLGYFYITGGENSNLSSIDLSNNTQLKELRLGATSLPSLDLTHNPLIAMAMLNDNNFTHLGEGGLMIAEDNQISFLSLSFNQFNKLDCSVFRYLGDFYCTGNNLTSLDLSRNPDLYQLHCGYNQLTELDLSKNRNLRYISSTYNNLTFSSMTAPEDKFNITNKNYLYFPQREYQLPENEASVVDLSSEYDIDGMYTTYTWYAVDGTQLVEGVDYHIAEGITTFLKTKEMKVYCLMENNQFPSLVNMSSGDYSLDYAGIVTSILKPIAGVDIPDAKTLTERVYTKDNRICVENQADSFLSIYNVSGQLVKAVAINSDYEEISIPTSGVFIVKLNKGNEYVTQKIIIK
jgi:Uncharacterized protein related to plant photosystem II stability/assembly factor